MNIRRDTIELVIGLAIVWVAMAALGIVLGLAWRGA